MSRGKSKSRKAAVATKDQQGCLISLHAQPQFLATTATWLYSTLLWINTCFWWACRVLTSRQHLLLEADSSNYITSNKIPGYNAKKVRMKSMLVQQIYTGNRSFLHDWNSYSMFLSALQDRKWEEYTTHDFLNLFSIPTQRFSGIKGFT